jgi:hypothetical protein
VVFLPYLVEKYAQQLLFHGLSAFRNCPLAYVLQILLHATPMSQLRMPRPTLTH